MGTNFLAHLHALGGGVVGYLIPFLFVLSLVVFFHELGHFLVARWCGVRILVFSIGFGPELVGFYDRYGTRWKISAIPLGGYVKFFGDENAASVPDDERARQPWMRAERAESFMFQPVAKRAAIVVAGPLANFLLAIVIFAGMFMLYGKQTMSARVDDVQPGSAAADAGFQARRPGRRHQRPCASTISPICSALSATSAGEPLDDHRGARWRSSSCSTATPTLKEVKDIFGNVQRVGILGISRSMAPEDLKLHPVAPPQAVWLGGAGDLVRHRPHDELYRRRDRRP